MTTPTALLTAHPRNPKLHLESVSDSPQNLQGLKRLNSLLLPVNYGEKFYRDITDNPDTDGALTRVAFWDGGLGVVGGVRARYEPVSAAGATIPGSSTSSSSSTPSISASTTSTTSTSPPPPGGKVYIMTLCTLSPFRGLGIAAELLRHVVDVAREWRAREVYAHVWVENHEALEWYANRGFVVGEEVVKGYYRRLKPDGARIVVLRVGG